MRQTTFTFYFFSIGVLYIILEHYRLFFPSLFLKALIIPSLMFYYYTRAINHFNTFHRLILLGLLLSWFGDIFVHFSNEGYELYFDKETYFLMGLSSFLVANAIYGMAFSLRKGKNSILNKRIYQLVLIVGYGAVILWLLYNKLITESFNYRVPVIVYTIVILGMLATALNRFGKVNGVSYMLVVLGSLLFVVCVSLLAINKFYEKFDFARFFIMVSYISAQYMIAIGCLRRDFDLSKKKAVFLSAKN